jgi:predicted RecB family nuclease
MTLFLSEGAYRKKWLSKSDYLAGLQCPKYLWLRINEPKAVELEPDANLEALFNQGRRVGALARTYVPGGTLIDFPYYAVDDKLAATKQALNEGAEVIYEAAFVADNQFVAIDILERTSAGFDVTEVKSSTKVKPKHLQELALQAEVLRECGIEVSRLQVMHINRECVYPNLKNLFVREDVTKQVKPLVALVAEERRKQKEILAGLVPDIQIGPHCADCPFKDRCWADVPEHHVTTIYAMRGKKAFELVEQGFTTIQDLPGDFNLSPTAERQRRSVLENTLIVEESLADALQLFPTSIGFLDFETVGLAVPVWDGCRPYDAVPVQFSFIRLQIDGSSAHHEWIADGPEDPRKSIARALIDACQDVERIVAYNAPFEIKAIDFLSKSVPGLANELQDIKNRIIDLLPVVREHIYHPEFSGGFSLKQVIPALLQEDAYAKLEIADGSSASWLLEALMFERDQSTDAEYEQRRSELTAYCRADTECLAKLLEKLREMASSMEIRAPISHPVHALA